MAKFHHKVTPHNSTKHRETIVLVGSLDFDIQKRPSLAFQMILAHKFGILLLIAAVLLFSNLFSGVMSAEKDELFTGTEKPKIFVAYCTS